MKKYLKLFIIWIILISYIVGYSSSTYVAAASSSTSSTSSNSSNFGQALEIAPPLIYLTVNPGQTIDTQILLRDISGGELNVTGQVNDFIASGENGTPKILLNSDTNDPYSLKSWIQPLPSLLLTPQQIKSINVTINVPDNASPGGHYGIIRFTGLPPSLQGTGVSLSASLGALVLLTVNGNINESLSVQQFSVNKNGRTGGLFESGPLNFVEVLKNTGNVHVQPVGQVSITDMFGNKLADLNVNLPPGNVLPSSSRLFSEPLNSSVIGNKLLFGRYTANLKVTYGTSKKVLTSRLVFWVIPFKLIAIIIIALIAGFFIIRYLIKRYNKHILNQVQNKHNTRK